MMVKQNQNGTLSITYDDEFSGVVADTVSSSAYNIASSSISAINSLESTVEKLTKKPEVRPKQRSALEVKGRVVAKFYKDGFFTDSKDLIPAIKSIEVFNENTVKVTFVNGSVQKSTAQKGDVFSLEDGLLRCIVKEMIGKEGTAVLGKLLSYATDVYNKAEADKKKKAEDEEKRRVAAEKNRKKLQKHWEKKRVMEREKRIQEMAEAIVRAKEMEKNV